jgi:hypothetical protein
MPIKAQPFRHVVESFGSSVQVTIPSRKHILEFVWFAAWLIIWGYMTSGVSLVWELAIRGASAGHGNGVVMMLILCLIPFLVVLLGMGAFAIHTILWQLSGKEMIEATHQDLTVSKQVFRWKWSKVYSSDRIRNLRPNTEKLSMFFPTKRVRRFIGGRGMIAFDYGSRTPSFGLGISEEEAKQIILTLKGRLPQ